MSKIKYYPPSQKEKNKTTEIIQRMQRQNR